MQQLVARAQALLGKNLRADVGLHTNIVGELLTLVIHRRNAQLVPEQRAVLAVIAQHGLAGFTRGHGRAQGVQPGLLAVALIEHAAIAPQHFFAPVAGGALKSVVDVDNRLIGLAHIADDDAIARRMQRPLQELEPVQGVFVAGNVGEGANHP